MLTMTEKRFSCSSIETGNNPKTTVLRNFSITEFNIVESIFKNRQDHKHIPWDVYVCNWKFVAKHIIFPSNSGYANLCKLNIKLIDAHSQLWDWKCEIREYIYNLINLKQKKSTLKVMYTYVDTILKINDGEWLQRSSKRDQQTNNWLPFYKELNIP